MNAARLASEQAEAGKGSDEEDDDESDGPSSANASKRNSLNLANGAKTVVFPDEKTPTAASLLSQAQASQRPPSSSFPSQASIRRHPGPGEGPLSAVPSQSPSEGAVALPMMAAPPHGISVRHMGQFPNIEEALGTNSTSPQGVAAREVWSWFQDHLDALLDSIRSYRFDQFEMRVRTFWSTLQGPHREVVHAPAVAGLMAKADAIVYDVGVRFVAFFSVADDASQLADRRLLLFPAGNFGVPALADAVSDLGRHPRRSEAARRQDGKDPPRRPRQLRQHLCRAQGRARRTLRPPRL